VSWAQRAQWLAVGLIAWLLLVFLSVAWLHTAGGSHWDGALASPLIHGPPWWLRVGLSALSRSLLVVGAAALAVVLLLRAVVRQRWVAVLTATLVPVASLTWLAQLRRGWLSLGSESFPSGHAVAGFAVLVSVALLWPRGRGGRWSVGTWLLALAVVAAGNVTLHAHQPGDVISSALLVTAVSGVLLGLLGPGRVTAGTGTNRGTMGPP
jgi:membrane-associated phospholipid phosphatase